MQDRATPPPTPATPGFRQHACVVHFLQRYGRRSGCDPRCRVRTSSYDALCAETIATAAVRLKSPNTAVRTLGARVVVFALVVLVQAPLAMQVHAAQMTEQEKIDALLQDIEAHNDLRFLRLGSIHSSAEAVQMLRIKLRFAGSRVKTANLFIDRIASATASGSTYYVIYPDGRKVASRDFLRGELKRISQDPKVTPAKR